MALFLLASGRIASAQDQWELEMRGEIGIPHGYVQVRENKIHGTHLDLRHDLGIETSESFGLEVVRRLRSRPATRTTFSGFGAEIQLVLSPETIPRRGVL